MVDGKCWGVTPEQTRTDGTGHAPPTIVETSLPDGGSVALRVLFNLMFFGQDHRNQRLSLVATDEVGDRLEQAKHGPSRIAQAGHRAVYLSPGESSHTLGVWEEQGAWIRVSSQGVDESDVLRFISALYEPDGGETIDWTNREPS